MAIRQEELPKTAPEYRVLGRTGINVSSVGYGATRSIEPLLVETALNEGINFIDTGRSYYRGQHEAMVGKVIKPVREKVIVQSKMHIRPRETGEALHTEKARKQLHTHMESMLNQSLKALQSDYVDIMLIHGVDKLEILNHETVMEFFSDAKKQGKIRACGFSSHLHHVEMVRDANRSKFYDVVMIPYNHKGAYTHSRAGYYREWDQPALEEELKATEKNGIGVVAMKTCSGGPYSPDGIVEPSYAEALKWILSHHYVHTLAVSMGSIQEMKEDVQAMHQTKPQAGLISLSGGY